MWSQISISNISVSGGIDFLVRDNRGNRVLLNGDSLVRMFGNNDRLGNLIYDNKNAGNADGWDGTFMGRKLPYGVFVWVAEGIAENGQLIRRTGSTALIT